jgi:hypothetical protein
MCFRPLVFTIAVFLFLPASVRAQNWHPWEPLSDPYGVHGVSAVSWAPNRLDVFAINRDGRLWHKWFDNQSWGPAELLGPDQLEQGPTAVSWGPNRLDIFAVKALDATQFHKSQLWHEKWDGSAWSDELLGEASIGSPLAIPVSWGSNRIDLFASGASGTKLWHGWWNGAWGQGELFDYGGGSLDYGASAASWGANRLDIFGTNGNPSNPTGTRLYHRWFDGVAWGAEWRNIPPLGFSWLEMVGGISTVSWGPGRLDLFAIRWDRTLWHYWFDGQHWAPDWEMLGSPPFGLTGTPSAVSWGSNRLDIFALKVDGGLWHQCKIRDDYRNSRL